MMTRSPKFQFKLAFNPDFVPDAEEFFKLFSTWIADSPEIFVDVADYKHVQDGPLVYLYGHFADYALDDSDRKLGFVGSYKRFNKEDAGKEYQVALEQFLKKCALLEEKFNRKDLFDKTSWQWMANDRAQFENTESSFEKIKTELKPAVEKALDKSEINFQWQKGVHANQRLIVGFG